MLWGDVGYCSFKMMIYLLNKLYGDFSRNDKPRQEISAGRTSFAPCAQPLGTGHHSYRHEASQRQRCWAAERRVYKFGFLRVTKLQVQTEFVIQLLDGRVEDTVSK
jgi:hypothetical protein